MFRDRYRGKQSGEWTSSALWVFLRMSSPLFSYDDSPLLLEGPFGGLLSTLIQMVVDPRGLCLPMQPPVGMSGSCTHPRKGGTHRRGAPVVLTVLHHINQGDRSSDTGLVRVGVGNQSLKTLTVRETVHFPSPKCQCL